MIFEAGCVFVASLLGTPLAGGFLMAWNQRTLGLGGGLVPIVGSGLLTVFFQALIAKFPEAELGILRLLGPILMWRWAQGSMSGEGNVPRGEGRALSYVVAVIVGVIVMVSWTVVTRPSSGLERRQREVSSAGGEEYSESVRSIKWLSPRNGADPQGAATRTVPPTKPPSVTRVPPPPSTKAVAPVPVPPAATKVAVAVPVSPAATKVAAVRPRAVPDGDPEAEAPLFGPTYDMSDFRRHRVGKTLSVAFAGRFDGDRLDRLALTLWEKGCFDPERRLEVVLSTRGKEHVLGLILENEFFFDQAMRKRFTDIASSCRDSVFGDDPLWAVMGSGGYVRERWKVPLKGRVAVRVQDLDSSAESKPTTRVTGFVPIPFN